MKAATCGHAHLPAFSNGDCINCANRRYAIKAAQKRKKKGMPPVRTNRPTRIKQESSKRAILNRIYRILSSELKPLHKKCEIGKPGTCTKVATDIHHPAGREGFLLIMSRLFWFCCRSCHDYYQVNSSEAIAEGYSLPRLSKIDYSFTDREKQLIREFNLRLPKYITDE